MRIDSYILGLNRLNLERTTSSINRALERLSTGRRVNSARDDVAAFSASTTLDAQIRGLTQGIQNVTQSSSLLQTASSAIESQMDLVQRMRELAVQAANETLSASDRTILDRELQTLISEYQRITSSTEFNGQALLNGDLSSVSTALGNTNSISFDLPNLDSNEVFQRTRGNGSFGSRIAGVSDVGYDLQLDDLDNDGHIDVVTRGQSYAGATYMAISLGNGDGTFSQIQTLTGPALGLTQIRDTNNDGIKDIISIGGNNIRVYLGNGDGTFQVPKCSSTGASSTGAYFGDFNRDGKIDIANLAITSQAITILNGNGDGTFTLSSSFAAPNNSVASYVTIDGGDLNGDGYIDLVYQDNLNNRVTYFLGNGSGGFSGAQSFSTSAVAQAYSVRVTDLNGDGYADIAVGTITGGLRTFINNGVGSFSTNYTSLGGTIFSQIDFADFDGDGIKDFLFDVGGISGVYKGNGNGSFTTLLGVQLVNEFLPKFGDVNGDDVLDIVSINDDSSTFSLSTFIGQSVTETGVSKLRLTSSSAATEALKILDTAISNLVTHQSSLATVHNRLYHTAASQLLLQESLSDSRSRMVDADIAEETSELVRHQILQQAQIAVAAQANMQIQVVIDLLSF